MTKDEIGIVVTVPIPKIDRQSVDQVHNWDHFNNDWAMFKTRRLLPNMIALLDIR